MTQVHTSNKLQYVPLSTEVDWAPLLNAYKRGAHRTVKKINRRDETPDGEYYYEVEVEGHELTSYYVKIIKNEFGSRGSCHCHDFRYRKLRHYRDSGEGLWCKHLLIALMAVRDLEENP